VTNVNLATIVLLQEVGLDERKQWFPIQAPLHGFRLKMNLPYIRRTGYSTPPNLPMTTILAYGYAGAIRLKNGDTTYLYR
jgi:hypothetical protein